MYLTTSKRPREIIVKVDDLEFRIEIRENYVQHSFKHGVGEEESRHYSPRYGYIGTPEVIIKKGSPLNEEIEYA